MGCGASAGGQLKLHSAIRWHSEDDDRMDQILANISCVNLFDQGNGNQALHLAAQNGKVKLVELLIKNNAEIDGVNFKGNTALHMATEYEYWDCVKCLLEHNANRTIKNKEGHTAETGIDGKKTPKFHD